MSIRETAAYIAANHETIEDQGLRGEVRRVLSVADGQVLYQTSACPVPIEVAADDFSAWAGPEVAFSAGRWTPAGPVEEVS